VGRQLPLLLTSRRETRLPPPLIFYNGTCVRGGASRVRGSASRINRRVSESDHGASRSPRPRTADPPFGRRPLRASALRARSRAAFVSHAERRLGRKAYAPRHARHLAARGGVCPRLRKVERAVEQDVPSATRVPEEDTDPTVADLACRPSERGASFAASRSKTPSAVPTARRASVTGSSCRRSAARPPNEHNNVPRRRDDSRKRGDDESMRSLPNLSSPTLRL
jgi:hypothetical protein